MTHAPLRAMALVAVLVACGRAALGAQGTDGGSDQVYDAEGRMTLERTVLEGGAVQETWYRYDGGRLVETSTLLDGAAKRTVKYLYDPLGRLVSTRESGGNSSGSTRNESGTSTSWLQAPDTLELRDYDADGHLVASTRFLLGELQSREERTWQDGVVLRATITNADGTTTVEAYQTSGLARGQLASRSVKSGSTAMLEESRSYDDDGRLAQTRRWTPSGLELLEYAYDAEGALRTERISSGSSPTTLSLVVARTYDSPTTYLEESYDAGVLFARVRYQDGRRVLEEILKDGIVVRTRQLQ